MLTLAEIKRRAKVGARIDMTWHAHAQGITLPMPRTVLRVQTNAIVMTGWPGKSKESWLHWPSASDIRIDGPDSFTVLEDGAPLMSYRFV